MKVKMLRSMSGDGISWRRGQIVDMQPKGSSQRLVADGMAEPVDGDVVADHIYAAPKKAAEPSSAESGTAAPIATGDDDGAGDQEPDATGGAGDDGAGGEGSGATEGHGDDSASGQESDATETDAQAEGAAM